MTPFYRLVRWVIRWAARILFRVEWHGVEKLPSQGAYLCVANHASYLDPPLVACGMPRECHTLAKAELFDVPILGWLIQHLHAHAVRRGGVDRAALRQCVDILRQGNILLLFPEGTRSRDGELQPQKNGAAMIATMADVPIVPTYVEGTFEAWPIGRRLPRLRKIRVFYGEPFLPPRTTAGERPDYDALSQDIMSRIASLKAEAAAHK